MPDFKKIKKDFDTLRKLPFFPSSPQPQTAYERQGWERTDTNKISRKGK